MRIQLRAISQKVPLTLIHNMCSKMTFLKLPPHIPGTHELNWLSMSPGNHCSLLWRHNERDSVSNHQRLYCLLKRLFRRRSKVTSKLRVTGLCAWNSPGTGEFPAQKASNAENVSIWWRHHVWILSWHSAMQPSLGNPFANRGFPIL